MDSRILCNFYRCTIDSILTAWYGRCTSLNRKALQRVVKTAQPIIRMKMPSMEDLYTLQRRKKAIRIIKDPNHPSHKLFCLLPSSRWSHTTRFKDSFIPQVIRLLNSWAHELITDVTLAHTAITYWLLPVYIPVTCLYLCLYCLYPYYIYIYYYYCLYLHTERWQIKGKTKCLNMESGHHKPPEQRQCSLPSLWNSIGGMKTIPAQNMPSFIFTTFS